MYSIVYIVILCVLFLKQFLHTMQRRKIIIQVWGRYEEPEEGLSDNVFDEDDDSV